MKISAHGNYMLKTGHETDTPCIISVMQEASAQFRKPVYLPFGRKVICSFCVVFCFPVSYFDRRRSPPLNPKTTPYALFAK